MGKPAEPRCLVRRRYGPASLLAEHPPVLSHASKRLVFDLACPAGAKHSGTIELTRWIASRPPERVGPGAVDVTLAESHYDYAGDDAGVWHVNFADPHLFVAYGSPLMAQDEIQAAEHPLLGCLREALLAEGQAALTAEGDDPTPVLVTGVERRCAVDTAPNPAAGRQGGLYGNRFAAADANALRSAIRVLHPPTRSHLIAMAAPSCGYGSYRRVEIERILRTAWTGFSAALRESGRLWPGTPVEIRSGFWGCGAFGGNRRAMVLLQTLAARLAGIVRLRFHVSDARGTEDARAGLADLDLVLGPGSESLDAVVERIWDRDYLWGESDGN